MAILGDHALSLVQTQCDITCACAQKIGESDWKLTLKAAASRSAEWPIVSLVENSATAGKSGTKCFMDSCDSRLSLAPKEQTIIQPNYFHQ